MSGLRKRKGKIGVEYSIAIFDLKTGNEEYTITQKGSNNVTGVSDIIDGKLIIPRKKGIDAIDEDMKSQIKGVVQQLVAMMDEATEIVDFFQKWDEQRRVRRNIKRTIIKEFNQEKLVKPITDRFMELAEVKFR